MFFKNPAEVKWVLISHNLACFCHTEALCQQFTGSGYSDVCQILLGTGTKLPLEKASKPADVHMAGSGIVSDIEGLVKTSVKYIDGLFDFPGMRRCHFVQSGNFPCHQTK